MKKHIDSLAGVMLFAASVMGLSGCSSESLDEVAQGEAEPSATPQELRMVFNGDIIPFDAPGNTRAAGNRTWRDGEVLFLQFYNGTDRVPGRAAYSKSTNSWTVSYNGDIGTSGQCEAYFFDTTVTTGSTAVSLTDATAIYADKSATYYVGNVNGTSELGLDATLSPMTGRIRFKGDAQLTIQVEGITSYTGYDAATNTFTTSEVIVNRTVESSGYSSYVYGLFSEASSRQLSIVNGWGTYLKSFSSGVLQKGKSGSITIPTSDLLMGWEETLRESFTQTVMGNGKTVSFKMILVENGSFDMGSTEGNSKEKPVHRVTLTKNYYMGETEVTQALWYAVMGQSPTSDGSQWNDTYKQGDNYPAYYISYEDCEQFITKLNALTGMKFRFPTEAEWEFAAKGGNKSRGYTYAGSNTIDDVAWYAVNALDVGDSSSAFGTHQVRTKSPNELGLYDMSGNVYEWCYDWYGSYTADAQTDPTGATTGDRRVCRGGCWNINATYCRCTLRTNISPTHRSGLEGFRLAL